MHMRPFDPAIPCLKICPMEIIKSVYIYIYSEKRDKKDNLLVHDSRYLVFLCARHSSRYLW